MDPSVAKDLALGGHLLNAAKSVVSGLPTVARGAANVAQATVAPFGLVGPSALKAVRGAGGAVANSPGAMKTLVGAGVLAPILGTAAMTHQENETQKLLNASQVPERTVLASLNRHFLKTAAPATSTVRAMASQIPGALFKGVGGGLGTGLVDAAFGGAKMLGGAVLDSTVTGPKRERVFYEAVKTDSVLRDALRSNPAVLAQLKEAFATLVRFAPSLSLDINAVRSYLREAVISGGGINFATIKQLADTEKVIQDRNRGQK